MAHPFYGVNGQPFLDLAPFIDTDGLDAVAEEMALLFVRHGRNFPTVMFNAGQELYPPQLSPEVLGFDPMVHPRSKLIFDGPATRYETHSYNSFFSPVLPLEQYMHLRVGIGSKGADWQDTHWAEFVPQTMEWLRRLPCDLTRVTVYYSSPGQMMGIHRDTPDYPGFNTPLIYVNPLMKPFFVLDQDGNRRVVDTKVAHFNNCDFHGMDQNNYRSCFSIRTQGKWHDWLLDATNTREHFANQPE